MMLEQGGTTTDTSAITAFGSDPATNTTGYIEPWLHSGPEYVRGNRDPHT